MSQKDLDSFKNLIAHVFNPDGFWDCERCIWLDCDERICTACEDLRYSLRE